MIKNFVKTSLKNSSKGKVNETIQTHKSLVLNYPCSKSDDCTPYVLELSKAVYKFECWGSKGGTWDRVSTAGLGGYTSGILYVPKPTTFFVYIGNIGIFNAAPITGLDALSQGLPGGATDVRLNYSENWYDNYSLISRIMVAAGGGSSEWSQSIGGNGGTLNGGTSSFDSTYICQGGTQTSGSKCSPIPSIYGQMYPTSGTFGIAGVVIPISSDSFVLDYGGFGGGGYYGGTSYPYAYAGSGGSSFISGHRGCKAVKNQSFLIEHTEDSLHYSGLVFMNTTMIPGNETMPLPTSTSSKGTWDDVGAFRITLLQFQYACTCKLFLKPIYKVFILSSLSS